MLHAGTESKDGGRKTVISLGGALPSLSCLSLHPLITPSVSISVPSSVSIPASLHFFSSLHFYTLFSSTCFVYLLALIPPFALWMFPVFLHSGGEEEEDMKKKKIHNLIHSVALVLLFVQLLSVRVHSAALVAARLTSAGPDCASVSSPRVPAHRQARS